jgi:hypothetical protein
MGFGAEKKLREKPFAKASEGTPASLMAGVASYPKLAEAGGEGGIRTHVPAFGRQDAFEAPPL